MFHVTGTPPIYTAIMKNSTVLVNTTDTAIARSFEEGNYTCEATSQYGSDLRNFSVMFRGKTLFRQFSDRKCETNHLPRTKWTIYDIN